VLNFTNQQSVDEWNRYHSRLDSDVESIQLVTMKTGVTTYAQYVLLREVEIDTHVYGGKIPLLPCRSIVFLIGHALFR